MKKQCQLLKQVYNKHNISKDDVYICWAPGHIGIPGNKKADHEARQVAKGPTNNSAKKKLPIYL